MLIEANFIYIKNRTMIINKLANRIALMNNAGNDLWKDNDDSWNVIENASRICQIGTNMPAEESIHPVKKSTRKRKQAEPRKAVSLAWDHESNSIKQSEDLAYSIQANYINQLYSDTDSKNQIVILDEMDSPAKQILMPESISNTWTDINQNIVSLPSKKIKFETTEPSRSVHSNQRTKLKLENINQKIVEVKTFEVEDQVVVRISKKKIYKKDGQNVLSKIIKNHCNKADEIVKIEKVLVDSIPVDQEEDTQTHIKEEILETQVIEGNCDEHLNESLVVNSLGHDVESIISNDGEYNGEYNGEVQTEGKAFTCSYCFLSFSDDKFLTNHLQYCRKVQVDISVRYNEKPNDDEKPNDPKKIYVCDVCGKAFNAPSRLQRHVVIHSETKPYKCEVCGKGFKDPSNLQSHTLIHGDDKPHKCEICGKVFLYQCQLRPHMILHGEERPFACIVCKRSFHLQKLLTKHMRIHARDKPFICDLCGKGYIELNRLQKHLQTHTTEKPYKCDVCGKAFSGKYNLQLHARIHSGDKPHKCEVCGKAFVLQSGLHTHVRIHTGEKPYKCDICGKEFNQTGNLQTHIRTHTGEKPYNCKICGKKFSVSSSLRRHIRTHN